MNVCVCLCVCVRLCVCVSACECRCVTVGGSAALVDAVCACVYDDACAQQVAIDDAVVVVAPQIDHFAHLVVAVVVWSDSECM